MSLLNERDHSGHKWRNRFHSALLLGGMLGLLAVCAGYLLGAGSVPWVLAGGGLALVFGPRAAPRLVFGMYGARPLDSSDFPEAVRIVRILAERAGLPRPPALYRIPSGMINAFAVGNRQDAAIAITDGMLRELTHREFAGVLAHEISHIRNNDLWIMNLADMVSRLTAMLSFLGVMLTFLFLPLFLVGGVDLPLIVLPVLILAPTIGSLLQLALSRTREYDADLDAVSMTRDPQGLASALARIERVQAGAWERIVFPGARIPEPSLLRTHPSTEERIGRILAHHPGHSPTRADNSRMAVPAHLAHTARRPRRHWSGLWY